MILFAGCATTNESNNRQTDSGKMEIHDPSLKLSDYLKRVSGVTVHESGDQVKVTIRGSLSFNASSDPLFVVDGVRSGNDYNRIENMVPVESIHSIEILKDSEASAIYGLAGSNGAIVIRTVRN